MNHDLGMVSVLWVTEEDLRPLLAPINTVLFRAGADQSVCAELPSKIASYLISSGQIDVIVGDLILGKG